MTHLPSSHPNVGNDAAAASLLGFVRHGHGPEPVLVLHDWLGDHGNYAAMTPYLDGDACTYVFADLRGYGLSRHLTGACTVDEIAADCLALADHLGWPRFNVLGHSMTGMVTQRLAANAPDRIKRAIAVCPVSAAGNRLGPDAYAFFASTAHDDEAFCRLMQYVTGGLGRGWAQAKLRRHRASVAPACRIPYLDMLVHTDFVDEVRGLTTPYLVIVGDKDSGLDEAAMRQTFLAWHPNAQLRVMPNCGHYPMQECPPAFAALIEAFLADKAV